MYAQLCKRLSDSVSQFDGQAAQQQQTFLDVLSKVCWEKFENRFRYYQKQLPTDEPLSSDEEERQHVIKQKMLGNLKFIGELYLLGQLDDPIIHNCILQLLGNDKVSADLQVRCQDLECLCQLVRTCGKSLDAGPGGNLMDQYFAKMAKDSNKHQVYPPRIRFMLRDVIDLRDNQWVPRTAMTTQLGPMPIHLLRGSQREDDDREAASAALVAGGGGEHHHYGSRRGDPFGTGSPVHGGNDRGGSSSLYGGRGSGGGRGNDPMLSSTDLFMSKIPGFNDMFNSLSMGPTSTSSMLPPPPLMHNNRYLSGGKDDRDHRGSGGGGGGRGDRDRNNDYYRGGDRSGGEHRGGDRDHRENKNYRNNNNSGGGNYGGREGSGNQYGGRGSGNYRENQSNYQNNRDGDDRRGGDAQESYNNNGGGGGGRSDHREEGRNNYYNNNRSNSPFNRENNQSGGGGQSGGSSSTANRENNRGGGEFNNRDRDYNGMNGGNYNSNNGGGGQRGGREDNYHNRQRNNNQSYNNTNSGQNSGAAGGGGTSNYNQNNGGNNRYNNNSSQQKNQNGNMSNNNPGGMYDKKDLAPRFKRTMMGSGGPGGVGGQHGGNDHRGGGGGGGRDNNQGQNYHNMDRQGGGSPGAGGQNNNSTGGGGNNMSSSSSSASSATGEAGAAGVENLQMRPAANSLLFKANTMNVNKLPLSQPQQRVIPTNSMLAAVQQTQSPQNGQTTTTTAASAGGGGGGGGNQSQGNNYYQGRDSNPSPFRQEQKNAGKKDIFGGMGGGGGGSQRGNEKADWKTTPELKKPEAQTAAQITTGNGGSAADKKGKKKDKGATKEEVLKKFNAFLDEVYFQKSVMREVEELVTVVIKKEIVVEKPVNGEKKEEETAVEVVKKDDDEEEKNKADELESEKKEEVEEKMAEEVKPEEEPEKKPSEEEDSATKIEDVKPEEPATAPVAAADAPAEQQPEKEKVVEQEIQFTEEVQIEKRLTMVEQDQPLEEIVKQYLDLKVPDKFVKDCLALLYTVSMDKEVAEAENEPRSLSQVLLLSVADDLAAAFWQLSPLERCVVFIDELKKHTKLGNNVGESMKQTIQAVANDTPKVMPWLTKLLGTAIFVRVYGIQELAALADNGKYHPLVLDTLQRVSKDAEGGEGRKRLLELFVAAKVDLLQTLPEQERNKEQLVAVLDERQLDFLCPLLKVQSQMWKQIKADANPQLFYKWIKENVDAAYFADEGFIRALVTVLLKHITQETTLPEGSDQTKNPDKALIEKEKQALEKYCAVLNAFLTSAKLQLLAIYALQVYCHSVDFPKGMLLRWFTALYDFNVIEEEAFLQWKEDLTEVYPGKQRALFQVNAWLMWLQEAESEEEEEN